MDDEVFQPLPSSAWLEHLSMLAHRLTAVRWEMTQAHLRGDTAEVAHLLGRVNELAQHMMQFTEAAALLSVQRGYTPGPPFVIQHLSDGEVEQLNQAPYN